MKKYLLTIILTISIFAPASVTYTQTKKKKAAKMIKIEEAKAKATGKVKEISKNDEEVTMWEEKTVAKPYGWYFVFTTKKYIKSRSPRDLKFGVPFIYVSKEGELEIIPTSVPLESFIRQKEDSLQKKVDTPKENS